MDLKRRWKTLSFKVEYLRLEVEEKNDAINEYEKEFLKIISNLETEDISEEKVLPLINIPTIVDLTGDNEELSSTESIVGPDEMKKLWKLIASISHPDKTNNNPEKTLLYKRAHAAWKSKSYDELYKVALELKIDPPEASEEAIGILSGISIDLEKKLVESNNSVLWIWGTTTNEKKQGIIDIYLRSRGKKRK